MPKIGVFDSGIGGKSVAAALAKAFPDAEIIFRHDPEHFPYASKPPEEILGYVLPILQDLERSGCQVIVIACNTVSTTLITPLREAIGVPLVAIEPMVKPAVEQSKSGKIIVCATPTTLASKRYAQLKAEFAAGKEVFEPDCSDWSYLIENNLINREHIDSRLQPGLEAGADVVVLGCTHYHWIEENIKHLAGKDVTILQPESAIAHRVAQLLGANF